MTERFLLTMHPDALSPSGINRYHVISASFRYFKAPRPKIFCIKIETLDAPRIINIRNLKTNADQIAILKNALKKGDNVFICLLDLKGMSYLFNNKRSSGIALYASKFDVIFEEE